MENGVTYCKIATLQRGLPRFAHCVKEPGKTAGTFWLMQQTPGTEVNLPEICAANCYNFIT